MNAYVWGFAHKCLSMLAVARGEIFNVAPQEAFEKVKGTMCTSRPTGLVSLRSQLASSLGSQFASVVSTANRHLNKVDGGKRAAVAPFRSSNAVGVVVVAQVVRLRAKAAQMRTLRATARLWSAKRTCFPKRCVLRSTVL